MNFIERQGKDGPVGVTFEEENQSQRGHILKSTRPIRDIVTDIKILRPLLIYRDFRSLFLCFVLKIVGFATVLSGFVLFQFDSIMLYTYTYVLSQNQGFIDQAQGLV